jgi:hypothetical protein
MACRWQSLGCRRNSEAAAGCVAWGVSGARADGRPAAELGGVGGARGQRAGGAHADGRLTAELGGTSGARGQQTNQARADSRPTMKLGAWADVTSSF